MALILEIKVIPKSGVNSIMLDTSGKMIVRVKSPPEEGKANRELIKLFAHTLRLPQTFITFITGATNRHKKIKIDTSLTLAELLTTLGLDRQQSFLKTG